MNKIIFILFSIILLIFLTSCQKSNIQGEVIKELDDVKSANNKVQKDNLKIGFQALALGHAPAQYIKQSESLNDIEFFNEPEIMDLPGGVTIINALSSKQINMVYGGWGFILPIIKGLPAKIVAGIANGGNSLVCNSDKIKKIEDLKGKKIAVHGQMSTHATVLRLALKEAGLDYKNDVQIVVIDRSSQVIALTEKKSIDCILTNEPIVSKAVASGAYISLNHEELYNDNQFPQTWVFARNDLIENNPEEIEKFLLEHSNVINLLNEKPRVVSNNIANYYDAQGLEITPDELNRYLKTYNYNYKIDKDIIDNTLDFLLEKGLIENRIEIDDLVDCSFGNCIE